MVGEPIEKQQSRLLTIGQLADYAGVTIKTIRHYHQRGLLDEPARDASGYRRYGADHAIALVKIKTLADAGVPLARVSDLLASSPEEFDEAIDEIDQTLQQRIENLARTRERLAQLSGGDRLFVSEDVADYLDRLRDIGVTQRAVRQERDTWILLHAVSPHLVATWVAEKSQLLHDPEFCALYLECDAAYDWPPDDPRLEPLAERISRWSANHQASGESDANHPPAIAHLARTASGASSLAWSRLGELAKEGKWKE